MMCNKDTICKTEQKHQEILTLLKYQNEQTNKRIEQIENENTKRFDTIIQKLDLYTQQQITIQEEVIKLTEKTKTHTHRINDLEEQRDKDSTFIKSIAVVVIAQIIIAIIQIIDFK